MHQTFRIQGICRLSGKFDERNKYQMGLYLSDILGGPDQINKPFAIMTSALCRIKEGYMNEMLEPDDGILNVVFQYHGTLLKPEFTGIRTGSFSKAKQILIVQVSVPEELLVSDEFMLYYVECLKNAIRIGKNYFDKKKIAFSLEDHLALVERSVADLL